MCVHNTIYGAKWGIYVTGGSPNITGRNTIENNTAIGGSGGYGLYVTSTSPFSVTDNNTFKNNSVAGIYLGPGTNVTIRDNNTIADNAQYGIWINGSAIIAENQTWWNDIWGNGLGIYVDAEPVSGYFYAKCNWWADGGGPDDDTDPITGPPDENDNDAGQDVSDYFWYRDPPPPPPRQLGWLSGHSSAPSTSCTGGL